MEKLEETSTETTIGIFIREIFKMMDKADEREKQILKDALIYGLDAFAGKQITPRFYD